MSNVTTILHKNVKMRIRVSQGPHYFLKENKSDLWWIALTDDTGDSVSVGLPESEIDNMIKMLNGYKEIKIELQKLTENVYE